MFLLLADGNGETIAPLGEVDQVYRATSRPDAPATDTNLWAYLRLSICFTGWTPSRCHFEAAYASMENA
jgi:hypothetical protein